MKEPPLVVRVRASNFRSLGRCDVHLHPLNVLLGFNAAGKSNFLDILRFVSDAVENGPVQAAARRGGFDALLHRSPGHIATSLKLSST